MRTCSRSGADCNAADAVVGGTGSETTWFSGVLVQADNNTASAMPRKRFTVVSVAAIAALLGWFNLQLDFHHMIAALWRAGARRYHNDRAPRCLIHARTGMRCGVKLFNVGGSKGPL